MTPDVPSLVTTAVKVMVVPGVAVEALVVMMLTAAGIAIVSVELLLLILVSV